MKRYDLRVEPRDTKQWPADLRESLASRLGQNDPPNVYKTMANYPDLMRSWMPLGEHVLFRSTLPSRDRELIILRMGWLCESLYEWTHHLQLGRGSGLTEEEIRAIQKGPAASHWSEKDRLLLEATDELRTHARISDSVWTNLGRYYELHQLMDVVFTAGQYNLACMVLNTFGVQLEEWAHSENAEATPMNRGKHEFASPGWLRVLHETLERLARAAGPALKEVHWSVCEVFTGAPLHLAQTVDRRIAWYCRLRDGQLEFGLREIDDADYKVVADYQTVLPLARLVMSDDPAALDRVNEVRARALADGSMRIEGSRENYPAVLATLHDDMVRVTL